MRVMIMLSGFVLDQKTNWSPSAHETNLINRFLTTPDQCIGQGLVNSEKPYEWRMTQEPNSHFTLSMRGEMEAPSNTRVTINAEVATEDSVSLNTQPTVFMEPAEKVSHLVQQMSMPEEFVEYILEKFGDVDITLRLGSYAELVFRSKDELISFLDQCADIRKQLES